MGEIILVENCPRKKTGLAVVRRGDDDGLAFSDTQTWCDVIGKRASFTTTMVRHEVISHKCNSLCGACHGHKGVTRPTQVPVKKEQDVPVDGYDVTEWIKSIQKRSLVRRNTYKD